MIGGRRFACHRPEGHGMVSLRDALAQSCNVFAYAAGPGAGPLALEAEARRFHFDTPTGLNLPGETRQMIVPGQAWMEARQGAAWGEIDTANLAIGQGFLRVTPLQAAAALASLARGETRTVPTLLHEPSRSPSGPFVPEPLGLDSPAFSALRDAMEAVVAVGIGREAQVPGVRLAGKTGTAQITQPGGSVNVAWFVAFAPVETPQIAIAVALEAPQVGVEFAGAEHAAPVVSELAAAYFGNR
jgi:penicillin-binding protein 2